MAFNFNINQLSALQETLKEFQADEKVQEEDSKNQHKVFLGILRDICNLVQGSDGFAPDFQDIVAKADGLLNDAVDFACGDGNLFDFIPSFAHSETNPKIPGQIVEGKGVFSHGNLAQFLPLINMILGRSAKTPLVGPDGNTPKLPPPWRKSMKPHPLTSRLSRFRGDVPISTTSDTPIANAIYEARCEITSYDIPSPIGLHRSPDGACMTLLSAGGYKDRTPILHCFFPSGDDPFAEVRKVVLPLTGIAYNAVIDSPRKLVFAGDADRVKSFAWGTPSGANYEEMLPTHTLASRKWSGPLAVLSGDRLIRGGRGSVGVWNIEALETHGPDGTDQVGGQFYTEDSCRDDYEEIEESAGSAASATIALENAYFDIARWHAHPAAPGVMLSTSTVRLHHSQNYSCLAIDLEHGGKTASRYLGHGGEVQQFYTSTGDPNVFITACTDGYARLYDVRHPLPVLTLDSGNRVEGCPAAVLVHPDGIPTVFTGAERQEQIKMWDIRARSVVYELSTGNNAVVGMEWDSGRNTLFAVTDCRNMDRMGETTGYRRAKIPRDQEADIDEKREEEEEDSEDEGGDDQGSKGDLKQDVCGDEEEGWEDEEMGDDGDGYMDEDDDDDDDDYDGRCWPKNAHHAENYFGYLFDAGEHRMYCYAFKESPDISVLPVYGQASLRTASYW